MENNLKRHTLLQSVLLHLLPGILVGAFYLTIAPFIAAQGFPSVMALLLAGVFVLIPFELGFLIYQKKRSNNKLFGGIIKYNQRIPLGHYFVWAPLVLTMVGLIFTALNFSSEYFITFFSWLPSAMIFDLGLSEEFTKPKLLITYAGFFLFLVIILPTIEELYFRGYLLPRMPARLKAWTALVHSSLFALYHIWTPWMFFARALGMLPLIYMVRRKNIVLGIIVHACMNSIDFIMAVIFILNY